MSLFAQLKTVLGARDSADGPNIAVFGDSHTYALLRGAEAADRRHLYDHIRIWRLRKQKNGKVVGDADLSRFCREIRNYKDTDFVFSMVGGNQYAVISTVQEPVDYDFLSSPTDDDWASDNAQLVPFRAIAALIDSGVRGTMGPVLREIRQSTRAQVFHLAPPPPKQDNAYIARHFEGRFAEAGIDELGPTRPELRFKCWRVQYECLSRLCKELDIVLIAPPGKSRTDKGEGFLAPPYYAKDVTHGNRHYGELVLKQILKITRTGQNVEAR
jgi:hypothetical protein